jgi:hypothetical protein
MRRSRALPSEPEERETVVTRGWRRIVHAWRLIGQQNVLTSRT